MRVPRFVYNFMSDDNFRFLKFPKGFRSLFKFSEFPCSYLHDRKNHSGTARDSFIMQEAAQKLGVSYMTIFRLVERGVLKPYVALRIKLISQVEIDRFFKEGEAV
jgi:excisionase family DNA binding protein